MASGSSGPEWIEDLGMTILHDPPDMAAVADVVFIHGLQGNPRRTWRYKGRTEHKVQVNVTEHTHRSKISAFFKRDRKRHNNIRIMTYGYDSHISHFFSGAANKLNITQHGRSFLNSLAHQRWACQTRPIILVAHSLGGLIAKEAIIESRKQEHNKFLQSVYRSVRGVIFFGTPHRGSGIAGWGLILSAIANATLLDNNQSLLRDLDNSSGTSKLEELRRDFNDILDEGQIKVHTFQEAEGKFGLSPVSGKVGCGYSAWNHKAECAKVVPDESSSFDSRKFEVIDSINANHMNMCRFSGHEDDGYKKFVAALTQHLYQIATSEETEHFEKNEKRRAVQAKFHADLLDRLRYGEMSTKQTYLVEEGVEERTIDWIWSASTNFPEWLSHGQDIFWLSGKAASGKSVLVSNLTRHDQTYECLRKHSADRIWIIAQFYFDFRAGEGLANNLCGLLRSLLVQLIERIDPENLPDKSYLSINEILLDPNRLRHLIINLLSKSDFNLCIFIDGLDEYEGDMLELLSYLKGLHQTVSTRYQSEARLRVFKLCLACRADPVISMSLSACPRLRLQDHNLDGINKYISLTLQQGLSQASDASSLLSLTGRLAQRAEGVFLWASFAIRDLMEGYAYGDSLQELSMRLEKIPNDLQNIYARIFHKLKPEQMGEVSLIFALVCHSMRPLSLEELSIALEVAMGKHLGSMEVFNAANFERRIVARSGGLLEVASQVFQHPTRSSPVKLLHETVGRFLRKDDQQNLIESSLAVATACVSKTIWLKVCCKYFLEFSESQIGSQLSKSLMSSKDAENDASSLTPDELWRETTSTSTRDEYASSLLQYAALYIFDHARVAEETTSSYQMLGPLLQSSLLTTIHDCCLDPPCHWCADLRLWQQYYELFIDESEYPWTAALSHGLLKYVEDALAEGDLSPRSDDKIMLYALATCFSAHRMPDVAAETGKSVISMLLRYGAAVEDKHFSLALRVASPEVLELLLPRLSSKVAHRNSNYMPLWSLMTQRYLGPSFEDTVNALQGRGDIFDHDCGDGGSGLHAPILFHSNGHYEKVRATSPLGPKPDIATRSILEQMKFESYESGEAHRLQLPEHRCAVLLRHRLNVNILDADERTPLQIAWYRANTHGVELAEHRSVLQPIMRVFIQYRASIDWTDDDGTTPTKDEILSYTRLGALELLAAMNSERGQLKRIYMKEAADKERRWTNRASSIIDVMPGGPVRQKLGLNPRDVALEKLEIAAENRFQRPDT